MHININNMLTNSCFFTGNRFSSIHGCLLITCAWLYALLFACSPLVYWGQYGPEPYGTACCIDWRLSNQHATARTYTLALFILCYILPSCVIVASYAGILVTVHASRKNMEQHAARKTHMGSIQTIIVKVRASFCIDIKRWLWFPYLISETLSLLSIQWRLWTTGNVQYNLQTK